MPKFSQIRPGDRVVSIKFGTGTVIAEWGSFQGCPECAQLGSGGGRTKCCRRKPHTVLGRDIFDIRHDNGRDHPIHRHHLIKL